MKRRSLVTGLRLELLSIPLFFALALARPVHAADTDIYGSAPPSGEAIVPNVVFLLDNTSNWSAQSQNWNSVDSWNRCKDLADPAKTQCMNLIEQIYYAGSSDNKRPWSASGNYKGVEPQAGPGPAAGAQARTERAGVLRRAATR